MATQEKKKMPCTPTGRVSFPAVFVPNAMKDDDGNEGKDKKFNVTLLFPPGTDLTEMKKAAEAAAFEKWGEKARSMRLRTPFRDGGEKEHLEGYEAGMTFVRFSTKSRPHVVDQQKRAIEAESGAFYAGCHARVTYTVFAYSKKGNSGVSFGLVNVQKVRDDEPFSGCSSDPDDDFEEVADDDGGLGGLLG